MMRAIQSLRVAAAVLVAASASTLSYGCAGPGEEESLIIEGSPLRAADAECIVDPSTGGWSSGGILDVSFGTPYSLGLAVKSQLLTSGAVGSGTENGEVSLLDAQIQLRSDQLPQLIEQLAAADPSFVHFTDAIASQSLAPGATLGVAVQPITAASSQAISSRIPNDGTQIELVSTVVIRAKRTGAAGDVGDIGIVTSREFDFPITVCNGCLQTCATCENFQCPVAASGFFSGGICGNAQDTLLIPIECGGEAP